MILEINGGSAQIDPGDLGLIEKYRWSISRHRAGICYVRACPVVDGKQVFIYMHRLLAGITGDRSVVVDHINGDGLDNRRSNLRIVRQIDNAQNRVAANGGAQKSKDGFIARVRVQGVAHYLGRFKTADEARKAYREACNELRGEMSFFRSRDWRQGELTKQ